MNRGSSSHIRSLSAALALLAGTVGAALQHRADERGSELSPDVVVRVGAHGIARADYERALAALQAERRTPIGPADRRLALERLVEEELLLQGALAADRVRSDPAVARALVDAVLAPELVTAEAAVAAASPTDDPERVARDRSRAREAAFERFLGELRADARVHRPE